MTESTTPVRPRDRKRLVVISILFVIVVVAVYGIWNTVTQSETGIDVLSGIPVVLPSQRLAKNLSSSDNGVVRESLAVLKNRKDPAGMEAALPLLQSKEPYIWFNAALYLGSMQRPESVPYLIKGLRHRASLAYAESAADLTAITGKSFGTDFQKWHEWWETTHPSSNINFDSDLGK